MKQSNYFNIDLTNFKKGGRLIKKAVENPDKLIYQLKKELIRPFAETHSLYLKKKYPQQKHKVSALQKIDDRKWLLIVLDACRYDRFALYFDDYFEGSIEPVVSAGVDTFEYVGKNWPGQYELPYITAAAPITTTEFDFEESEPTTVQGVAATGDRLKNKYNGYIPRNHLQRIIEVWRTNWDEDLGVCPPEPVTDRAIELYKEENPTKAVVHYFQPHAPFIGEKKELDNRKEIDSRLEGGAIAYDIWQRARFGDISRAELIDLYDKNLECVLDSVVRLIHETDFDHTIIMGDHGEALGEYNQYAHGIEHPYVRLIPWAEVTDIKLNAVENTDNNSRNIDNETDKEPNSDVVDRLQELGYIG